MSGVRAIGLALVLGVAVAGWMATCSAWRLDEVVADVAPLDPRAFGRLTLVTVGTGGAYENPHRRGPALAVGLGERVWLVDAGRAVTEALRAARIPVAQPEAVLLTHLMPENTVGLDDLLVTGWLEGREQPLRLIGPPGTRALASAVERAQRRGIEARAGALGLDPRGARFEPLEVGDGWTHDAGDLRVRAGSLPGGPLEALAYRFEAAGRAAVVAGAGWAPDALVELASGAHLLALEAVFVPPPELAPRLGIEEDPERLRREAALHTSIEAVGDIAQRAGVETLVLVRLRPPPVYDVQITRIVDDDFPGRIVVADDGDELTP